MYLGSGEYFDLVLRINENKISKAGSKNVKIKYGDIF